MRLIAKFGDWTLSTWPGSAFLALLIVGVILAINSTLPKTVTLNAKEWECASSGVKGIDAVCVEYKMKGYMK